MVLPPFLTKTINVIILTLVILLGVATSVATLYARKNSTLHEDLAVQIRNNQILTETHNQQVRSFTTTIDRQNATIETFKLVGDKQVQEMGKVQHKVDNMRLTAEQQLAEMRKKNVATLSCEQSIALLLAQSKTLQWGVPK